RRISREAQARGNRYKASRSRKNRARGSQRSSDGAVGACLVPATSGGDRSDSGVQERGAGGIQCACGGFDATREGRSSASGAMKKLLLLLAWLRGCTGMHRDDL